MTERDTTEDILVAAYEAAVEDLRKANPVTREGFQAQAAMIQAWKDLKEYRESKRK